MMAGRSGSVTKCSRRRIPSISASRFLIMRQHLIAWNLLFLQSGDHSAIVLRRQMAVFRDLRRDGLHLALQLRESPVGQARQFIGRIVDAVVFERDGVELGWKAEIVARFRQHVGANKVVIGRQLFLEFCERALVGQSSYIFRAAVRCP